MSEFVERIKEASAKSSDSANTAVEALGDMSEKINSAWEINDANQKSVGKISDSISSLAAVSEEISSSMDEMANQANISSSSVSSSNRMRRDWKNSRRI